MLFPNSLKYKKQFKPKLKKTISNKNIIKFGHYAIQALTSTYLTSQQIEATRKVINRKMNRLGFIWIRIFPDKPITKKPTETRMGKGKGSFSHWVAKINKGQILFEISYMDKKQAKLILTSSSTKLPIKTKFIYL